MSGSLALHAGVLWVGRHAKTARVDGFDLEGRPLHLGVRFRDDEVGRSSADGIGVDADRRLWVADGAAGRLRCFTVFGRQVAEVAEGDVDTRGALGQPVDVVAEGSDDALVLLAASGGKRRHALQELRPADGAQRSLRSLGDPERHFDDLVGVARQGDLVLATERRARRIQVFRGGVFHFAVALEAPPSALAPLEDGRWVVAFGAGADAVRIFDGAGRPLGTIAGQGEVDDPVAVAVQEAPGEAPRVFVLDQGAERIQVFGLDGRSWGAFPPLGVALDPDRGDGAWSMPASPDAPPRGRGEA